MSSWRWILGLGVVTWCLPPIPESVVMPLPSKDQHLSVEQYRVSWHCCHMHTLPGLKQLKWRHGRWSAIFVSSDKPSAPWVKKEDQEWTCNGVC